MRRTVTYSWIFALLLLAACGGRKDPASGEISRPRDFPSLPKVPSVITEPAKASEYVIAHFWDAFTDTSRIYPCDTALVNGVPRDQVESAVGICDTVGNTVPVALRPQSVEDFFSRIKPSKPDTSTNLFEYLTEQMSRYLYDPNSPVRNEDLYLPFVSRLAVSEYVPADLRPAYSYDARMCALNPVGSPAADIVFKDLSGKERRLYDIKAERTLLFFTNPGCPACKEIMETIQADGSLSERIARGQLAVVNLYIDRELDEWRSYASEYPSDWYNGHDPNYVIRTDVSYNIRAIPALYLLDAQKRVLLKDAPAEKVLAYLSQNNQ